MPRTALYLDFEKGMEIEMPENAYTEPDARPFLLDCLLDRSLNRGSFGVAFRIVRDADEDDRRPKELVREWVVKLPRSLLRPELFPRAANDPQPVYIGDALQVQGVSAYARQEAAKDFEKEFQNAEQILEPPLFRRLNRYGGRIVRMPKDDWERLMDARDAWRTLEGYAHLHPVLHYEASFPALISTRADGMLADLRDDPLYQRYFLRLKPDGDAQDGWYGFARQITSAVAFILRHTPLAHIDIKPANIFFTRTADTFPIRLQLGDYGVCYPKDDPVGANVWSGTASYNPPLARGRRTQITYGAQSVFQLAATLLAILSMPDAAGAWAYPRGKLCEYALTQNLGHLTGAPAIVRDILRVDPFVQNADDVLLVRHFVALKRRLGVETQVFNAPAAGNKRPRDDA